MFTTSTKTARDLIAGIRANLGIIRSDLHDLRHDLASDLRYLRADLHYDWLDLADNLRADLTTRRDRRAARRGRAIEWQCTSCHQTYRSDQPGCPDPACGPPAGTTAVTR